MQRGQPTCSNNANKPSPQLEQCNVEALRNAVESQTFPHLASDLSLLARYRTMQQLYAVTQQPTSVFCSVPPIPDSGKVCRGISFVASLFQAFITQMCSVIFQCVSSGRNSNYCASRQHFYFSLLFSLRETSVREN